MTLLEFKENQGKVKIKKKKEKKEDNLQVAVCKYLHSQYPDAIFICDVASGMKLQPWIAKKISFQKSSRGIPDITIYKKNNQYSGLCLELKKDREGVFLKDGSISTSKHISEQNNMLQRLTKEGFYAVFSCGWSDTKKIIDWYMGNL